MSTLSTSTESQVATAAEAESPLIRAAHSAGTIEEETAPLGFYPAEEVARNKGESE